MFEKSKTPRKITEHSLRNIALHYLQRYASSKENLKRVLKRRVMRSAQFHVDLDTEEASQ
jgi:regulatory protein